MVTVTAACAGTGSSGDGADAGATGKCKTECGSPDMCCLVNGAYFCIDVTAGDRNNCGTCSNVCNPFTADQCAGDTCQCGNQPPCASGACCAAPGGAACVDTSSDPNNCGSCGHACGANGQCQASQCVCNGGQNCTGNQICCSTGCVDPTLDGNCGACGTTCSTSGQTCQGTPPACSGGTTTGCTTGKQDMCGGVCQDICGDAGNCGGCGQACNAGDACLFGLCFDTVNIAFYQAGPAADCTML
jgi:hypothetical protein